MEIKEFIQNFADQFDDTDASVFTSETKFKELEEWSSLTALSVIAMIDEEYDVKIKGDDVRNSQTVNDLYEMYGSPVSQLEFRNISSTIRIIPILRQVRRRNTSPPPPLGRGVSLIPGFVPLIFAIRLRNVL